MSISWIPTQVINRPLTGSVADQLNLRREILSTKKGLSDDEIKYLHSNTGWVKVSSGVDEIIKKDGDKDPELNSLAKQNVLFGGTFDSGNGIKQGILSDNSSYSFSEQYGYRPMAGITSFSIQNLDTFGAVRKATIDFTVNSLEDLTKFEKLYLRPGFTAMVEFGHSISLKTPYKDGPHYFQNTLEYYNDFFDNIDSNKEELKKKEDESEEEYENRKIQTKNNSRLKKIETELKRLRIESGHNYDAMFGRISNFSWAYNSDTTYDCRFDIMGYGSVIESLSALSSENIASEEEEETSDAKTSIGNKFSQILDLGIETDPFILDKATGADEDRAVIEAPQTERNAIIAAVVHYGCSDGEEEVNFSDERDGDFVAAQVEEIKYLQVGEVFEFVKGINEKRFIDNATKGTYGGSNFIIVEVKKGEETVRGYIKTGFTNNQPTTNTRYPFSQGKILRDNTVNVLSKIAITKESQEFLNSKYVAPVSPPDLSKYTEKQVPVIEGLLAKGYKLGIGTVVIDRKYGTGNSEIEDSDKGLVILTKPGTLGRTNVTKVLSDGRSSDYLFNPN
jgi:hypothetical protein